MQTRVVRLVWLSSFVGVVEHGTFTVAVQTSTARSRA